MRPTGDPRGCATCHRTVIRPGWGAPAWRRSAGAVFAGGGAAGEVAHPQTIREGRRAPLRGLRPVMIGGLMFLSGAVLGATVHRFVLAPRLWPAPAVSPPAEARGPARAVRRRGAGAGGAAVAGAVAAPAVAGASPVVMGASSAAPRASITAGAPAPAPRATTIAMAPTLAPRASITAGAPALLPRATMGTGAVASASGLAGGALGPSPHATIGARSRGDAAPARPLAGAPASGVTIAASGPAIASASTPAPTIPDVAPASASVIPAAPAPDAPSAALVAAPDEHALLGRAVHELRVRHAADAALAALDEHRARFPTSALAPEAGALRVEALLRLGRKEEALRALDGLLEAPLPKNDERQLLRGELRGGLGQWGPAIADFDAVLARGPRADLAERALWGRAVGRSRSGRDQEARADLRISAPIPGRALRGRGGSPARARG